MIIFYPPPSPFCTPVVIADMTDSSDQWSTAEILAQVALNVPLSVLPIVPEPSIYSVKYTYEAFHNGSPLGENMKMHFSAAVKMPPAELISQTSINYFSTADSPESLAAALITAANPRMDITYAVIVEKTGLVSTVCREFIAYSSVLQPDSFGTSATLFIKGASYNDSIVHSALGFQLKPLVPLGVQLSALAATVGFIVNFTAAPEALRVPKSSKLFPPTTITKVFDELCLQNGMLWCSNGNIITIYSQSTSPPPIGADILLKTEFSFLGSSGSLMWAVGVENYANVKFKTTIFDTSLFNKITIYDDTSSGFFSGLKRNFSLNMFTNPSYDMYIIRYAIIRNDHELVCEITATNNWLFSQCRVDGILETKIYGGLTG